VREVTLRAAGLLAQHAHGLELVQQVGGRFVDMQHAVHGAAGARLPREHQRRPLGLQRRVVGEGERLHAGLQRRLVGHRIDAPAIDIDHRLQPTQ
jgi:hypothetical protein